MASSPAEVRRDSNIIPIKASTDWSEKHEIGARETRIIERALEQYLSSLQGAVSALCVEDKDMRGSIPKLGVYAANVRNLRDLVVACHSIRIIPDEDQ